MTALVVAMAGIILPAMAEVGREGGREGGRGEREGGERGREGGREGGRGERRENCILLQYKVCMQNASSHFISNLLFF